MVERFLAEFKCMYIWSEGRADAFETRKELQRGQLNCDRVVKVRGHPYEDECTRKNLPGSLIFEMPVRAAVFIYLQYHHSGSK